MKVIRDAHVHVHEEIHKYIDSIGVSGKSAGESIHVVCPFHDENTPSCSVNLDTSSGVPIGTFYCFGCGETGRWNKFAEKTGLEPLKSYQNRTSSAEGSVRRARKHREDIYGKGNMSLERMFKEVGNQVIRWPKKLDWRGYSGRMLYALESYCFNERRKDELMLVLPVYIHGRFRGGVRAFTEKRAGSASYLTTSGEWVKDYGLLGYDLMVKRDLFGSKSLVVVEGPRDWLRMMQNKIPSCAILGALMMSDKKMQLIAGLGVRHLYVLSDNDAAGARMARNVKFFADKAKLKCTILKLPRKRGGDGKLIELDPDNAPQKLIDEVKKLVFKKKGS